HAVRLDRHCRCHLGQGQPVLPTNFRDVTLVTSNYQMLQSTSPPTPALTAARPVITPRDVVRMLVPSPASTSGTSCLPKYTRRPGRLTRWIPVITRSPRGPYLRNSRSCPRTRSSCPASSTLKPWIYPSCSRILAISTFNRDAGMSTRL